MATLLTTLVATLLTTLLPTLRTLIRRGIRTRTITQWATRRERSTIARDRLIRLRLGHRHARRA
jgi:hypothetical protein